MIEVNVELTAKVEVGNTSYVLVKKDDSVSLCNSRGVNRVPFSREEWDTMVTNVNILIEEKPTPAERGDNIPLCKVPRVSFGDTFTTTNMNHCPFLDAIKQYYFPSLDSKIEDVHFNCFYPGKGPDILAENKISPGCEADGTNCCDVSSTFGSESFCCNGVATDASSTICVNNLRSISP